MKGLRFRLEMPRVAGSYARVALSRRPSERLAMMVLDLIGRAKRMEPLQ